MPDYIFGVEVPNPETDITDAFPLDPDFGFKRIREWKTSRQPFSNALDQAFIEYSRPRITFALGFAAKKGTLLETESPFYTLWHFFNEMRARQKAFWFYDPALWARFPYSEIPSNNHRDNPAIRKDFVASVTIDGVEYSKYLGRYVMMFEEDEISAERFERKLNRSELRITGYESFSDA